MGKVNELINKYLGEPARNCMHAMYDDYVETNVRFRSRSGMKTFIIRRRLAKCCDWCADLAGIYESGKAPDNVYQRHDNCKCMVTFRNEKGKYEDVWSKKEYRTQRDARIARIKELKEGSKANAHIAETGGKHYLPYNKEDPRDIAAAKEYRKISRRNDIDAVAASSGLTHDDVKAIKRHIFFEKHKLYEGYGMLHPDYDMAVAWKRLSEGRPEERDIILLKHELLESKLEKEYNLTVSEAHKRAKKQFNWEQALLDAVGPEGEADGLL